MIRKKKTYTIFYSWQSDTRGREREIIEHALNVAAQSLERDHGYKIEIDNSTLGEPGMPNITQTIMRKIDSCDIFICDMTPVAKLEKVDGNGQRVTKQLPNSNVLLELGYAMSAVGINYIIPLAHQGTWQASEMPFDINHNKIILFTKDNCDLTESINNIVEYIKSNGKHRQMDEPYWVCMAKQCFEKIKNKFVQDYRPLKIYEASTSFFTRRMAKAFPGKRGLVTYTSDIDIYRCLKHLLTQPLQFKEAVGYGVHTDPIWWSRGSDALDITQFKRIGYRRYLIGYNELKIKKIVAYANYARYYSEYVYIETYPDKPTGLYPYTKEQKAYYADRTEWNEEYAIFKLFGLIPIKVTKPEQDDGHKVICGVTVHIGQKCELRTRYLKPYNFIISAKKSAYYNKKFDQTSEEMFDYLLKGKITMEEFNQYMMQFPKPID